MYEFAKAIHHSLCPGAVPSLCHRQLQGQVSARGPSGDPSRVGSLGAPTLQLSLAFGSQTGRTPTLPLQVDLYLIPGVIFLFQQTAGVAAAPGATLSRLSPCLGAAFGVL